MQPLTGLAQWRVGSIDGDGIRYGFATSAWKISTPTTASESVSAQSISVRQRGWKTRPRPVENPHSQSVPDRPTTRRSSPGPACGNVPRSAGRCADSGRTR